MIANYYGAMTASYGLAEAKSRAIKLFSKLASDQLKALLETKHLYQRVAIDPSGEIDPITAGVVEGERESFEKFAEDLSQERFAFSEGPLFAVSRNPSAGPIEVLCLTVSNIKLFCGSCKARELFAPLWFRDLHNELRKPVSAPILRSEQTGGRPTEQLLLLAYHGLFLTLDGRSPMEGGEVSKYIPKKERQLFWEAIVAMNGGKPLAAIFFLRTFVEQFARRQTDMTNVRASGDEIMDAYAKTLPSQYREVLPSLKVWYGKLSEAIHSATADEILLEEGMREIDRHFKIRDAFNIAEASPQQRPTP